MKTVIEMAREAGLVYLANGLFWMDAGEPGDELERFAALVRADAIADEREACAKFVENYDVDIAEAIRARSNT